MCGIDFLKISVGFLKKTEIRFRMSLVWLDLKKYTVRFIYYRYLLLV